MKSNRKWVPVVRRRQERGSTQIGPSLSGPPFVLPVSSTAHDLPHVQNGSRNLARLWSEAEVRVETEGVTLGHYLWAGPFFNKCYKCNFSLSLLFVTLHFRWGRV